ncbi:hypothetical protein KSP39_PZI017549 [Platanthera zijinensis]|uniref:Uncharacterized protein n=1 Tax=Platanthera zijinensis TaxID=2320716 RepID=A0AAP0FZY6_9ASPA
MADTLMFKRLNPPSFNGSRDFFVISEWLSQMEKHFEYAGVPEAHKVHLAAYQLTEDAYTWWLQRRSLPNSSAMTWEQFKNALMEKFLSSVERDKLAERFLSLQQPGRTVTEYEIEFSRLSLLAAEFVPDESKKISRFVKGLRHDFRQHVVAHGATTYAETVGAALKVEAIEMDRSAKKVQHGTSNAAVRDHKRKNAPPQEQGPKSQEKSGHLVNDCRRKQNTCFRCGQFGHQIKDCPVKESPIPAQPLQAISGAQDKGKAVLNVTTQGEALASTSVISDRFTKVAHFIPYKEGHSTEKMARIYVSEIVRLHGIPLRIVSDRDSRFVSHFWKGFQQALGTDLNLSTAYHPTTDGQTERVNQILEDMLRCYILDYKGAWDEHLPLVEFAYNNSYQESLKMAPFEALYGRRCRTPLYWSEVGEKVILGPELLQEMEEATKKTRVQLSRAIERQRKYANQRRRPLEFAVGDQVFLKVSPTPGVKRFGRHHKLSPRFVGPCQGARLGAPEAPGAPGAARRASAQLRRAMCPRRASGAPRRA